MQIFTEHAIVPRHALIDKASYFKSQIIKKLREVSSIHIEHATIEHRQTIGMTEW